MSELKNKDVMIYELESYTFEYGNNSLPGIVSMNELMEIMSDAKKQHKKGILFVIRQTGTPVMVMLINKNIK